MHPRSWLAAVLAVLAAWGSLATAQGVRPPKPVATVNGRAISMAELDAVVKASGPVPVHLPEAQRRALDIAASSSGAGRPSVPNVVGEDQSTAMQDLSAAGFQVQVVDQNTSDQSQDGLVVRQDPAGGVKAEPGSTVTIWVGRFVPASGKKQKGPHSGPGRKH